MIEMKIKINVQEEKPTEGEKQVLREYEKRLKVKEKYQTLSFPPEGIE